MTYRTWLCSVALGSSILALGCGASRLTSVTVNPAAADARDFSNGQVQFTAAGTFSGSSHPVPVRNVSWCIGSNSGMCNGNIASAASILGNGVAQCVPTRTGIVTVLAGTGGPMNPPDTGHQFAVFGTAQLTCR
jgi:hypothetical protein